MNSGKIIFHNRDLLYLTTLPFREWVKKLKRRSYNTAQENPEFDKYLGICTVHNTLLSGSSILYRQFTRMLWSINLNL